MTPFGSEIQNHFSLTEAEEFREKSFVRKRIFETSDTGAVGCGAGRWPAPSVGVHRFA